MVSAPNITFTGANPANYWPAGFKMRPTTIVCHTMSGTYEGTGGWFRLPEAQASTNYGVAEDGRAACYVDPFGAFSPYANGAITNPDQEFTDVYNRNGRRNPNYWTISIEHEDKLVPNHQITNYPSQFEASTLISAWLCEQFGLDPLAPGTFLGHYQIDFVNRSGCPGWTAATWNSYVNEVSRKLRGGVIAPTPLTLEQEVARLKGLIAGNGWSSTFTQNADGSLTATGLHVGEEALKLLADGGNSAYMAIFQMLWMMQKNGIR